MPLEFVAFDVTEALQQIAEVLGESCTGEVLDRIFSQFLCWQVIDGVVWTRWVSGDEL